MVCAANAERIPVITIIIARSVRQNMLMKQIKLLKQEQSSVAVALNSVADLVRLWNFPGKENMAERLMAKLGH